MFPNKLLFSSLIILALVACNKKEDTPEFSDTFASRQLILSDISQHVIAATYADMQTQANTLNTEITELQIATTEANLNDCRNSWRNVRSAWEQSEGFLFGPVASENIDPRIDTWPVNHIDLDSILASSVEFTPQYIDELQDALKGFHPIEYLLFGLNGNKTVTQFNDRELSFLKALSDNLKVLCSQVSSHWNSSSSDSYLNKFVNAGSGSAEYPTQLAAYEEVVNAMIGICEEVAGGKISEPFEAQDPSLEESPYAQNSLKEFISNVKSVKNIYYGSYKSSGQGIKDYVRLYNLSLDAKIKQDIDQSIVALEAISDPFGIAISSQATLVQQAITRIETLKETLETQLLPLIQQQIKD
jgi:predicted lipoprotein